MGHWCDSTEWPNPMLKTSYPFFSSVFPKLHMYWLLWDKMCCTLSTMEPHAKEMKSQMLILVEPLWSYASTPKLKSCPSIYRELYLGCYKDSTNVHHMQLHVSWQFLGVAMLSRQKGAWRNNSVLSAACKGQVHIHGTSKQKISTHKVLRGGKINFLQGTWCSAGAFANIKSKGNMHSSVVATLG